MHTGLSGIVVILWVHASSPFRLSEQLFLVLPLREHALQENNFFYPTVKVLALSFY